MGFLCLNKEDKKIVSLTDITEKDFLQKVGLDNVNLLQPEINVCPEVFKSPEFYMDGVVKLTSGLTPTLTGCTTGATAVYNLTYTPEFDITFNITGNTEYTGYTGGLCYKIFSNEYFVPEYGTTSFSRGSETVADCISFSAITSTTITKTFLENELPNTWSQYLIRPYYSFVTKDCSPGYEVNTWDSAPQINAFNQESDYYFMTVIDPLPPILMGPPGDSYTENTFIQDILLKTGYSVPTLNDELNYFKLSQLPISDVLIFVNGVRMAEKVNGIGDYEIVNTGFGSPPLVKFDVEIFSTDWIVANYFVGQPTTYLNSDFSKYFVNTYKVDSISTDSPYLGYVNYVNINTTGTTSGSTYEFFTTQPLSTTDSIFLTINGVEMPEDWFYFKSRSIDNRIIFNGSVTITAPINVGDIISILAVSPSFVFNSGINYGSLPTPEFTINWNSYTQLEDGVTGRFVVQVFEKDDITNTVLYENIVDFVEDLGNYTTTITDIAADKYYRFTVTLETTYTGYLDNQVTTCSYSEGYFDTVNEGIIYSY